MIAYGTIVVYVTPRGRRYIKRLEEGHDWHSNDGTLPAEAVHMQDFGTVIKSSLGVPILIEEGTIFDCLKGIKRQTQIIYPKDIAYICLRLGAGPGRKIIEAGCGSGGLTLALSWFCGSGGKIVSHDSREEFIRLARRNLDWVGLGENVELHHRDIENGFATDNADALFLDVRTPWDYLEQIASAIKAGATVGFLLPTTDQVGKLVLALENGPFSVPEISEILVRHWKPVADRLRPEDRMVAHTGFLIFCRSQQCSLEFLAAQPKGTRERKQEAARASRQNGTEAKMPDESETHS